MPFHHKLENKASWNLLGFLCLSFLDTRMIFLDAQQLQQLRLGFYNRRLQLNSRRAIILHSPSGLDRITTASYPSKPVRHISIISAAETHLNKREVGGGDKRGVAESFCAGAGWTGETSDSFQTIK